jgi:hypothetical protein
VPSRSFQARGVTGPHTIGVVSAVRRGWGPRPAVPGRQSAGPGPARRRHPRRLATRTPPARASQAMTRDQPVTRSCAAGSPGPRPRGDVFQGCAGRRRWFEAGHPGVAIVTPVRRGDQWRAILPLRLLPRRPASGIPVRGLACAVRVRVPYACPTVPRARAVLPGAPAVTGCRRCMVPGPDVGHSLPGAASCRECTSAAGTCLRATINSQRSTPPATCELEASAGCEARPASGSRSLRARKDLTPGFAQQEGERSAFRGIRISGASSSAGSSGAHPHRVVTAHPAGRQAHSDDQH